jgi:hypothetical protein
MVPNACAHLVSARLVWSGIGAFRYVENLAQIRFDSMMVDIKAAQTKWETRALAVQAAMDAAVLSSSSSSGSSGSSSSSQRDRGAVRKAGGEVVDLSAYVKHANGASGQRKARGFAAVDR